MTKYLIAGTLLLALAPAAEAAARCKPGQIYRTTQGVCISKATAIRQGVYKPRRKARRTKASFASHVKRWAERNRAIIVAHTPH